MSKLKPDKQTVGFCLNAIACLVAIAAGLGLVALARHSLVALGLAASIFALIAQALIAGLTTPYIRRKSRPLLWITAGIVVLYIVSYIAVDLARTPIMNGRQYVGMGVALLVFEVLCLAMGIGMAVYCLIVTLRKSSEPVEEPDAPKQTTDTDALVAQAQDVVLRSKIAVEEAPAPDRASRRTVTPDEVRQERRQASVSYAESPRDGSLPAREEEPQAEPKAIEPLFDKILGQAPEEPQAPAPNALDGEPTPKEEHRWEPIAEQDPPAPSSEPSDRTIAHFVPPMPSIQEDEEDAEREESNVIFAVQGGVDSDGGAPLHDSDIRAEYATHHPRQKPAREDDSLYTDFGYGED